MSSKQTTVHLIGNAHIDPVWLWRWQEGFSEVIATCRSALDLLREYPDFIFNRSSSATYRWIEQVDPGMFEEIRVRVAEGRWNVVNGWVEQPDCNIPSGESFARHCLYGKRYFNTKLGVEVVTGWNVDTFGHNAGLPQILAKSGFKYYFFFRPGKYEKELPEGMFYWAGPDGTRILACRPDVGYGSWGKELSKHIRSAVDWQPHGISHTVAFFGVGNHGGGPTRENIESIHSADKDPQMPTTVISTPEKFIRAVLAERSDFPVVEGDLQHHAVGCYSVHSQVKSGNRRCELLLGAAECFSAIANQQLDLPYPTEIFQRAWETVLFNQFHDILAGTSIREAYKDVAESHGFAAWIAQEQLNSALFALSNCMDTTGPGAPIVVFNPLPWPVKSAVEYCSGASVIADESGQSIVTQPESVSPTRSYFGKRGKHVFVTDLPPLGWRVLRVNDEGVSGQSVGSLATGASFIENDCWRIEFNQNEGITRLLDRQNTVDLLAGPIRLLSIDDPSDTWSHRVTSYDSHSANFQPTHVELIEEGPVRAAVRMESSLGESKARMDVLIYRKLPDIEVRLWIDWCERMHVMKLCVPTSLSAPSVTAGAAYAWVAREANGYEDPFQQWVDIDGTVADKQYGLAMICQDKYGYDAQDGELRLTLLRSPAYALHEPLKVELDGTYDFIDQGEQNIRLWMIPHAGNWRDAGIPQAAERLANPPICLDTYCHSGKLPSAGSFIEVEPASVILGALKVAEDGDSLVMRLYESVGSATSCRLRIAGALHEVDINPYELKTLRIRRQGKTIECDILERPCT